MTASVSSWRLTLLAMLLPFALAQAGNDANGRVTQLPTADDLLGVFIELQSSIVSVHSIALFDDPRFYSRAWLEDAIRNALKASMQPEAPGLNWVEDSLLSSLVSGLGMHSVYGYALVDAGSERGSLEMRVLDRCNRPYTYTIKFVFEDGAWRISGTKSNSSKTGISWFHPGLQPIKEFASVEVRDRSRYFNESNLGKAIGLDVKNRPCGQNASPDSRP